MALALTVNEVFDHGQVIEAIGTIAASGSYVTGGDTLSFADSKIPSSEPPIDVRVEGESGFVYRWDKGTSLANGKVKVFQATTSGTNLPLAEHTAVAYVAGVTGDTIKFRALFKKLV